MRILITGGAGCLGSNLIEHWLPQDHEIFVIDNFATGKREVVPEVPGLTVKEGSIVDQELVDACFAQFQPEVVIHAAAAYKDPDDWVEDSRTNVIGSTHVARAAKACGAKRLINFQTALCYGRPQQLPILASHPTAPFTSYGITKTAGEQFMMLSGVPTLVSAHRQRHRPAPCDRTDPNLLQAPEGWPELLSARIPREISSTCRDFLAFMDLAIQTDAPTGVYNIASGEAHSIKEIFDLVTDYLGLGSREVPVVPPAADDVPVVALDASETLKAFGWQARVGFAETIKRQLAWYDKYGVSDVFSHLKAPTQTK
jgi:UDP-glucose 4-epimerase